MTADLCSSARRASRGALFAVLLALALPAAASAETFVVGPGSVKEAPPCTIGAPCEYLWAIGHAKGGDTVQFLSGEYDYVGGIVHKSSLQVNEGVTLEQAPGDATRPLIKQTTAFEPCSCATLFLNGAIIRGLAIEQAHGSIFGKSEGGAGAVEMTISSVVERSVLSGAFSGMYFVKLFPSETATGGLRDTVVTAANGIAVGATAIPEAKLDNVTAIAHGSLGGGVALSAGSNGEPMTLNATNTILRGDVYDVELAAKGSPATVNLHYSDVRPAMELREGAEATINEADHPTHGEPMFVSPTDLHEVLGSPTIDAGTPDAASGALDLAGLPRTVGPFTDIGAYEFQGTPPTAATGAFSGVGQTAASLGGTVNAGDLATTWYFNYGPTSAYGKKTAAQGLSGILAAQAVSATLGGLTPGAGYHYQLVATNGLGTALGADATFTTAAATPAPSDSALRLSRTRFRAGSRGGSVARARPGTGTTVTYTDSEAGTTTLRVLAAKSGVRQGHTCVKPPRRRVKHRHYTSCVRYLTRGSFTHADSAGANSLRFTGRLRGRKLPPGRYRLSATPRNSAGATGATVSAGFTIVR
jgi:hypothetical protein